MSSALRAPSTQWEPLAPPDIPDCGLWGWFFPPHAPQTVTVTVPQASLAAFGQYLTARRVIAASGLPVDAVTAWSAFGTTLETQGGANPVLDQAFPPMPGLDLEIQLTVGGAQVAEAVSAAAPVESPTPATLTDASAADPMAVSGLDDILAFADPADDASAASTEAQTPATPVPHPAAIPPMAGVPMNTNIGVPAPVVPSPVAPASGGPIVASSAFAAPQAAVPSAAVPSMPSGEAPLPTASGQPADAMADRFFAAIDADWKAIEAIERQLAGVTKQMNAQAGKLQSLNRDLSPQERLAADSNDVKEWNTVRRLLRDAAANISKQVRAFDIGTVSAAGNRTRLADIYTQFVQPRKPFDNMAAIAHEFEAHRKVCQNLLTSSGSALSGAQRDAEGKARSLLNQIKSKARSKR